MILIAAAILWVYWPALHGGYLWDDDEQFANIEAVRQPGGLWRIWLTTETPQYYPLSFTAFWAMHQLWGDWSLPYHVLNVLLHMGNTALVYVLLRRINPTLAAVGAACFGLHPVLVPAVAWMCQLRNLLSVNLALWTTLAWVKYETTSAKRYWRLALLGFVAAMLCKTAVAPLPIVLGIGSGAFRPRRGRWRDLAPMVVISIFLGAVTVWYEAHKGASGAAWSAGVAERIARMGWIGWFHLAQAVVPRGTCFVHPRWTIDPDRLTDYLPTLLGLALLAAAWIADRHRKTLIFTTLVCYFAMLFPVLGLFNVYFMRYSYVADHWQYPAMPVLAAGLVLGLRRWRPEGTMMPTAWGMVVVVGLGFGLLARSDAAMFHDQEPLWRDTLHRNPYCWLANNNYGVLLEQRGEIEAARRFYLTALRGEPTNDTTPYNLARGYRAEGRLVEAEQMLRLALRNNPANHEARVNLSSCLVLQGRFGEAAGEAQKVVDAQPTNALAHMNLGAALASQSQVDRAIEHYAKAVRLQPDLYEGHLDLANLYLRQGKPQPAIAEFAAMLAMRPDDPVAHFGMGCALSDAAQSADAIAYYRQALRRRPEWPEPANNLALILATHPDASLRDPSEAVGLARIACEGTRYQDPGMLDTLMVAHEAAGDLDAAIREGEKALAIAANLAQASRVERLRAKLETYRARKQQLDEVDGR